MMNKNEKIITLITNICTLVLLLAVVVPFGKSTVSSGEIVFKCLIAPIIACVAFVINSYVKYTVGSAQYKYNSFSAYLPVFGYLVAILMYAALISLRTGAGVVYEASTWIILSFFLVFGAGVAVVLGILIHRLIVMISTKENLFLDIAIFLVVVIVAALMKAFLTKHVSVVMNDNTLQFIVVPLLLALAVIALLVFIMMNLLQYNEKFVYASRQDLLDKWNEGRNAVYDEAREDILFNMYLFSKEQLGLVDELDTVLEEDEEVEETEEPEAEVEESKEVVEEVQDEVVEEHQEQETSTSEEDEQRIAELLKEKEELTAKPEDEPVEKPAVVVVEKDFKPSFNEMVKLAMSFEGVTYQANVEGTNYKFLVGKKVFLILADTPKEYRLTFLMDIYEAAILSQNTSFAKAKSPKGDYYFKLVNRGEFDEITIITIIKNAYAMVAILAERERIAREEEKARKAAERLQAKIDAMTLEERAAYYARLEKRRIAEEKKTQKEAEALAKTEQTEEQPKEE